MRIFFFFSLLSFVLPLYADSDISGCQTVVAETAEYTHCKSKVGNYPNPVHLYIPKHLNQSGPINLNVHFHGFNLDGYSHFDKKYGDYGAYISASNLNSVLAIPESKGKCETYYDFFSEKSNQVSFINNLKKLFSPVSVKTISFSGHSGAYKVLNMIFGNSKLEEGIGLPIIGVGLFDATYGSTLNIENTALAKIKRGKPFLFFDAYVSGAKATTESLSSELRSKFGKMESSRFQFVTMPTKKYPNYGTLDLHFGLLSEHGLREFFNSLAGTL